MYELCQSLLHIILSNNVCFVLLSQNAQARLSLPFQHQTFDIALHLLRRLKHRYGSSELVCTDSHGFWTGRSKWFCWPCSLSSLIHDPFSNVWCTSSLYFMHAACSVSSNTYNHENFHFLISSSTLRVRLRESFVWYVLLVPLHFLILPASFVLFRNVQITICLLLFQTRCTF